MVSAIAGVFVIACSSSEATNMPATDSTVAMVLGTRDVATASVREITTGIAITGSLDPARRVEVKSQIAGQIENITVDRGSPVRRGQVLVTFDAQAVRAQAASAEASLASAEREFGAADTLFKAGAVSDRVFVQARVARDAAIAQLAQVRETLRRATVESPMSGVVSERAVEPGEAVATATSLLTIVNTDVLELSGRVAPGAIAGVRIGQPVQLTVDAYSGRTITGRVARIEPVAEAGTRQVGVYVSVPNPKHELVAGLFATGLIVGQGSSGAVLTVPTTAVMIQNDEPVVFVIEQSRIIRRPVNVGARDERRGLTEVKAGLTAGELVLANPNDSVRPGASVRLIGDSAATKAVPAPATSRGL
jgi:RND family efflux transporter MFP subunit